MVIFFGQDTCSALCTSGIRSATWHIVIHARKAGTINNENGQEPLRDTAERCYEVEVAPGVQGRTWRWLLLLHRSAVQQLTRRSAPFLYKNRMVSIA